MPTYPTIQETARSQQVTDTFGGYNHNLKIPEGEFYEMENLCGDDYPLLATRKQRNTLQIPAAENLQAMVSKGDKLYYIAGYDPTTKTCGFYAEDEKVMDLAYAGGLKRFVSMGAYLLIWPDKVWYNTADGTHGNMEKMFSAAAGTYLDHSQTSSSGPDGQEIYDVYVLWYIRPCSRDGKIVYTAGANYGEKHVVVVDGIEYHYLNFVKPKEPKNGDAYIDRETRTPYIYNDVSKDWSAQDVPVMWLECKGIGSSFAPGDYIRVSGIEPGTYSGLNVGDNPSDGVYREVLVTGENYIVLDAYAPTEAHGIMNDTPPAEGYVKAAMDIPDMSYVIEAQNRLWGCKYGTVNGKLVNEIYASALGRFDVWRKYAGVSTDSYAASVGSDGRWTGAVNYQGYPLFFKEDRMHKVYVSASGAHRIQEYTMRGVQPGGAKSLAVVNGVLFYKARDCVCAYDGSGAPTDVSEKLNLDSLSYPGSTTSIAAAYRDKYYLYLQMNTPPGSRLLVLDTRRGAWYRESLPIGSITDFTEFMGSLLCAAGGIEEIAHDNQVSAIGDTKEGDVAWSCETGLIGYSTVEQKYVSRFNIRMSLARDAYMDVLVQYDSDGVWHNQGRIQGVGTRTFMLPVRPRRCDHFRIRLEGSGDVRIYSFAKIFEAGSDVYADI
jgi:hypothetical protein